MRVEIFARPIPKDMEGNPFQVGEGVTQIGTNAWSGMEDSVAINGTALSAVRYLAPGISSSQPSGAISGAEFETVQIIDGKAYLGVSVCTNGDLSAETESWGAAKLDPAAVEQADGGAGLHDPQVEGEVNGCFGRVMCADGWLFGRIMCADGD